MSRKINKIGRNISKILNFSPDLLTKDITVTIYSNYQVIISGYRTILLYDDNILVVSDGSKDIRIVGSKLVLTEMANNEIILSGNIKAVEFESHRR